MGTASADLRGSQKLAFAHESSAAATKDVYILCEHLLLDDSLT